MDERNLTIRTSIVGPELKQNGVGLFHWFMSQTGEIKGYTKAIWSGVTTLELAKAIERAAMEHWYGLYHLTNNQTILPQSQVGIKNIVQPCVIVLSRMDKRVLKRIVCDCGQASENPDFSYGGGQPLF